MYVSIRKKNLSIRRKDFKQKSVDENGKVRFSPSSSNLTRKELDDLYLTNPNFEIFQRYSFTIELRKSYRDENGKVKNKVFGVRTINSEHLDTTNLYNLKERNNFWKWLDSELEKQKIDLATKSKILLKVEAVVPRLKKEELRQLGCSSRETESVSLLLQK